MAGKYLDGSSLLAIRTYLGEAIASAIANVYNFKGAATCEQLRNMASSGNISSARVGDVYNVTDAGPIWIQFVANGDGTYSIATWDGHSAPSSGWSTSGITVVAGDNIAWTQYGWDKLAGTIDLSAYATQLWVSQNYLQLGGGTMTGDLVMGGNEIYLDSGSTVGIKSYTNSGGYADIYLVGNGEYKLYGDNADAILDTSVLDNGAKTFTFPNQSGTFLLDSGVSNFWAGGTNASNQTRTVFGIKFYDTQGNGGDTLTFTYTYVQNASHLVIGTGVSDMVLSPDGELYYGSVAANNQIVKKGDVECYTEAYALEILRQGTLTPTISE